MFLKTFRNFHDIFWACADSLSSGCSYHTGGEYTEDIAEFANSWAVQISDDAACLPTALDFSSPCSANAESTEVN